MKGTGEGLALLAAGSMAEASSVCVEQKAGCWCSVAEGAILEQKGQKMRLRYRQEPNHAIGRWSLSPGERELLKSFKQESIMVSMSSLEAFSTVFSP